MLVSIVLDDGGRAYVNEGKIVRDPEMLVSAKNEEGY
jgi:hypothetical protein